MKRLFDIVAAISGLVVLFPLFAVTALLVKVDSPGPIFFRQKRMGKKFKPFFICKFRTMVEDAPKTGSSITFGDDPRITRVGRLLRQSKIDELPQLLNVLKGDMSLVGPRPEVPYYVELFRSDYEEILSVRPGITDLASLKYSDEAAVLGGTKNPEDEYIHRLLPEKIAMAKEYLRRSSFLFDLKLIFETVGKLVRSRLSST